MEISEYVNSLDKFSNSNSSLLISRVFTCGINLKHFTGDQLKLPGKDVSFFREFSLEDT